MTRYSDLALTALAPAIWGSTYIVTTELLPAGYPITVAFLRALPAGLLLLLLVRQLPSGIWWPRIFLLGAFNFSIFWTLLFIAAYRLPGGVAATVGALQPLIVIFLARFVIGSPIRVLSIIAAILGVGGVSLLLLGPEATLDPIGITAGLGGALSMALGTIFTRKWAPPVSLLTVTAWQLTAGGILLAPLAFFVEPSLPTLTTNNWIGLGYLSLIGAAATYMIWFRGVARIEPSIISTLGFLSPTSALLLGWIVLGQPLTSIQLLGIVVIMVSLYLSQYRPRPQPTLATAQSN
ncbi:EamA family transporter [Sneathiella limimaris]|uniref:EamA family transporter n=1 Tax=Sneathiella limimaris TaxID=1964213 RepID=UPI00146F642F|nr:EamA family transporter [Sneathiella limimaris]